MLWRRKAHFTCKVCLFSEVLFTVVLFIFPKKGVRIKWWHWRFQFWVSPWVIFYNYTTWLRNNTIVKSSKVKRKLTKLKIIVQNFIRIEKINRRKKIVTHRNFEITHYRRKKRLSLFKENFSLPFFLSKPHICRFYCTAHCCMPTSDLTCH